MKARVKISNPAPGGRGYTSLDNARRYEAQGAGYFMNGQFVFVRGDDQERKMRRLHNVVSHGLRPCEPSPDLHSVLQPSIEWLRDMGY